MAEVVLRGADRANRRRQGLPEPKAAAPGDDQWAGTGPSRPAGSPSPSRPGRHRPARRQTASLLATKPPTPHRPGGPHGRAAESPNELTSLLDGRLSPCAR